MVFYPELYQHELDKRAFEALQKFPKILKIEEAYVKSVDEKAMKFHWLSSAIRLGENQFPEIYCLLPPICEKLGIDIPELYYVKSKEINAATGGNTKPYIVITSEMVKKIPVELISSILAHECGHIACKHCLYHSIARQVIDGIEYSGLSKIPTVRKFLTPTLVRALLFWDRCSELSADRAAVLCDENADKTVDVLLKIHGYKNINREEFLKQAMDLNTFVNDSKSNKLIEQMLIQDESHPRMAVRAYECYEWANTDTFRGLINGTYTLADKKHEKAKTEGTEVLAAEVAIESSELLQNFEFDEINKALNKVNVELDRYTSKTDMWDYSIAVFGGILAGIIDTIFVGEINITEGDIRLSNKKVNEFIENYAKSRGIEKQHLKDYIGKLEKVFQVDQDNAWFGEGIGVGTVNHHLADLAHHPTPLGLISAVFVKFLGIGVFFNRNGEWHIKIVDNYKKNIREILAPAVIAGVLNWLVYLAENDYEKISEEELPDVVKKLAHLLASTPMLIEVAKCADNWFGHLVSDMGGSKKTAGGGMGIPGLFISLLYEFSSLPILKDTDLPYIVNSLYQKQKIDLRHEIPFYEAAGKQVLPVMFNEIFVRVGYFIMHFVKELEKSKSIMNVDWSQVIPFNNRTIDRMMTISTMTFNVADTIDAAVHAAIESGANWVLFTGRFVTRYNYVGSGRAVFAIFKEVANEKRETQLIHEKMILSEKKAAIFLEQLQVFKDQLEEKVTAYLTEDIEVFMSGLDFMKDGIETGDANLVIKGNVLIQRVLGREPQYETQKEFDDLMESDKLFLF